MMPRWPLPIGDIRSTMRAVMFAGSAGFSSSNCSIREQRRQLLEMRPLLGGFRITAVDGLDLDTAGFLLVALSGTHCAVISSPLRRPNWRKPHTVCRRPPCREVALCPQEAVALITYVEETGTSIGSVTEADRRRRASRCLRLEDPHAAAATLAPTATALVVPTSRPWSVLPPPWFAPPVVAVAAALVSSLRDSAPSLRLRTSIPVAAVALRPRSLVRRASDRAG